MLFRESLFLGKAFAGRALLGGSEDLLSLGFLVGGIWLYAIARMQGYSQKRFEKGYSWFVSSFARSQHMGVPDRARNNIQRQT